MRSTVILFSLAFFFVSSLCAQSIVDTVVFPRVQFGGQVRYRGEIDGRFFKGDAKPLWINLLRTALKANIDISPTLSLTVQFQDSRNFGEEEGTFARGTLDGSAENFNLRQGFIEWRKFLDESLTLKVGRMIFATNSERLVGALEWHNVGRTYDGGILKFQHEKWTAQAFAFLLGTDELLMTAAARQQPQALVGIDFDLLLQDKLNLYFYHDRNNAPIQSAGIPISPQLERFTTGVYAKHLWRELNLEYEAEFAYQFGNKASSTVGNQTIQAWLLTTYLGYAMSGASLGGGVELYTGDNANTANTFEGFDHLFITIHKFYGYMDFFPFTVLPASGQRRAIAVTNNGLIMPFVRGRLSLEKWNFYAALHYFLLQEPFLNNDKQLRDVGYELDLVVSYKLFPKATAEFGFSLFAPGEALLESNPTRQLGKNLAYWGYTSLNIEF